MTSIDSSIKALPSAKHNDSDDPTLCPAPLTTDLICRKRLEECNYDNNRISLEDACAGRHSRPIRVYNSGVFDLFHFGHAAALRQAKLVFPGPVYLIAGVAGDDDCTIHKRQPVMRLKERMNCVQHCRYVDEVFGPSPWFTSTELISKMKIDFVCHDENPYRVKGMEDMYAWVKRAGIFVATKRTPNISTTDLIERMRVRFTRKEKDINNENNDEKDFAPKACCLENRLNKGDVSKPKNLG